MCCENEGGDPSDGEVDTCIHCGSKTYGGISDDICVYSPQVCEHCGYAPCDDSC